MNGKDKSSKERIQDALIQMEIDRNGLDGSALFRHAKRELPDAEGDPLSKSMNRNLLSMVALFNLEEHSGASASLAITMLERLLRFKPVGALTGEEDEWGEPYDMEGTQQNKRYVGVFRVKDGRAFNQTGFVFCDPNGDTYTNRNSWRPITFPYTPTSVPVVIHVPEDATEDAERDAIREAGYEPWED